MKQAWWLAGGVALLGAAGIAGLLIGRLGGDGAPSAERLALGRQVYDVHCASCHGAELEGEGDWRRRRADGTLPAPPHDASGHTWHHPDEQLFNITKQGIAPFAPPGYKTTMRGYAEILSDEEIWAVLDYIKSRWPEDLRARQADRARRAGG
jgi:mono/diheme cytochrome c family protein